MTAADGAMRVAQSPLRAACAMHRGIRARMPANRANARAQGYACRTRIAASRHRAVVLRRACAARLPPGGNPPGKKFAQGC
jgi:hypothetical protein